MDRRLFLLRTGQVAAGAWFIPALTARAMPTTPAFTFSQVALPYDTGALEPSIDRQTMEIHYNKHHSAYVKNVNEAIAAEGISVSGAEEFFSKASKWSPKARNNGGGAWNHDLFWQCMGPGAKAPMGKVLDAINGSFGDLEKFKAAFTDAAMKRFGSGWAWLIDQGGRLTITSTPNQDNPLMDLAEVHGKPLLALDVWEHAYYLKYQNKRDEYVANWWKVVDWEAVGARMA